MDTVVGLFDQQETAQRALKELKSAGFLDEDIHVITQENGVIHHFSHPGDIRGTSSNPDQELDYIIADTAKDMLGSLANLVLPEKDAKNYTDEIRRGGVLIIVHIPDGRFQLAQHVILNADAVDVQFIYQAFRETAWIPYGLLIDSNQKVPLLADHTI
jgi:hypothetical protein